MNKYHIAQSFQSLIEFYGTNDQRYRDVRDQKSLLSINNLKFGTISKNRIVIYGEFEAKDYKTALDNFFEDMDKHLLKIIFVTQTSVEKKLGCVIYKKGQEDIILKYSVFGRTSVGFSKRDSCYSCFEELLENNKIPKKFYWYCSDASMINNNTGKISIMLPALELLAKSIGNKHSALEEILGKELKCKLYGDGKNRKSGKQGIRNQLVHGDYFGDSEGVAYTEIQNKIIEYFNKNIFKNSLIKEIESPQRNSEQDKPYVTMLSSKGDYLDTADIINILESLKISNDIQSAIQPLNELYEIKAYDDVDKLLEEY